MSNPWFRLYSEIIDDWKIKSIAFEDRWHYVALLCLKNQGELDKELTSEQRLRMLTIKLGITGRDLEALIARLVDAGLISEDAQPLGWDERQFRSDSSTERVRAYRKRRKKRAQEPPADEGNGDETLQEQPANGDVTAQESDTDTDTDTEDEEGVVRVADGWVVTSDWKPPEAALFAARRAGVEPELLEDPAHLADFILKYSEAPQRDRAFSTRWVRWMVNEQRNPRASAERTDGVGPLTRLRQLAEAEEREREQAGG